MRTFVPSVPGSRNGAAIACPVLSATLSNALRKTKRSVALLIALFGLVSGAFAQTSQVVFHESFGTSGGSGTAFTTYTTNNNFDNDGLSYVNLGSTATDVRATGTLSSGYTNVSGGTHVFMGTATTNTREWEIRGINTTGFTSLVLSFGSFRTNTSTNLVVSYSSDGVGYTNLSITQPGTSWGLVTASGTIPATANLRIRFSKSGATNTDFRIDDVRLVGIPGTPTITGISPATVAAGSGAFTLTVDGTNFSRGATNSPNMSNGTAASLVTVDGSSSGITTTWVSATRLTASIPASVTASAGTKSIRVATTGAAATSGVSNLTVSSLPSAITGVAALINGSGSVTLNGTVNAATVSTTAAFEYGRTTAYGATASAIQNPITGSTNTAVSASISGLDPNVTYNFRTVATNAGGSSEGANATFVSPAATPNAPTVGNPTTTTLDVTISADDNPDGTAYALYETSTGKYVQDNGTLGVSADWQTRTAWGTVTVSGLVGSTTYSFEVVARNSEGITTANGASASGTTSAGNSLAINPASFAAYYCNASANTFNVAYSSGGVFSGTFKIQMSDAGGVFPNNTTDNIIGTGASSPISVTIPAGFAAGTGYRFRVLNDNPEFYGSDNGSDVTIVAALTPSVSLSSGTGSFSICVGTSITFTANPVNGGTPTYAWTKNGNAVGTNSATYTDASLVNNDVIAVTMTSTVGCVTSASATDNETITVNSTARPPAPVAAANPACATTTLNAMAHPGGDVTYYWQGTTFNTTKTDSAATAPYTVYGTDTFFVRAFNSITGCWSDTSSLFVTIFSAPVISLQPANTTGFAGSGITLVASASNQSARTWQVSTNGGTDWTNISAGGIYALSNTSSNTVNHLAISSLTTAMNGYQYRVAISGNAPCGVYNTNAATITVNAAQAVVFSENMGSSGTTTTVVNNFTGWQNNSTLSFRSTVASGEQADNRTSTPSANYANASASRNVFMGTAGTNTKDLVISRVNTSGFTNLVLSFGMFRTNVSTTLLVDVSADSVTWVPLTIDYPAFTSTWMQVTASGAIPEASNLRIRFRKDGSGEIRLDDIRLAGYMANPTVTSITPASDTAGNSTFTLTVSGTNFLNANRSFVTWDGSSSGITTTFVSATELSAVIPASRITTAGTYNVGVTVTGAQSASNTQTFTVHAARPAVTTGSGTGANGSSEITLDATVNANGTSTDASFEYGLTTSYGSSIVAQQNPVTGNSNTAVSAVISGLQPNVTYNFRALATSSVGTRHGSNATFVSPAAVPGQPTVATAATSFIDLTLNDGGNPAGTEFAIYETTTQRYVQANGVLAAAATWQSIGSNSGQWGSNTGVAGKARIISLATGTGYTFEVIARNSAGITTVAGTSVSATTLAGSSIVISSGVPASICNGADNNLTIAFTESGFMGTFKVQISNASGVFTNDTSSNIIGSGSASPIQATIPANYSAGTGYRIRVLNTDPVFYGDDNGIDMSVVAAVTPAVTIGANAGTSICAGTSVTFTATPVNGGAAPSYQWRKNGNNVGSNSATYTDAALAQGDVIDLVMTSNAGCVSAATAVSSGLTMTVNTTQAPPAITAGANPSCGPTTLAALTQPGGSVIYYWQGSTNNGTSTASPANVAFPVSTVGTGTYYVRALDTVTGCWSTQQGLSVVVANALAVTTQPVATNAFEGGNASLTAAAAQSSSVVWQVNTGSGFNNISNGGVYSGATTGTLTLTAVTAALNGAQFRAVFTGTAPCTTVTTNAVALTLSPSPATVFSENVGVGGDNVPVGTYTGWQNQGSLTFSAGGTNTDVRSTSGSSGYTGASGAGNVWMPSSSGSRIFEISNINTIGYSNLSLSFGMLRTSTTAGHAPVLEVSSNGVNYTALSYTITSSANSWSLITASGSIPAASNLRIRFSKNNTTGFRIDDLRLVGTPATPAITSISPASAVEGSSNLTLTVNGSNFFSSSRVTWAGSNLTTTFVSSSQLTATVPANLLTTTGNYNVAVVTTGALAASNSEVFTVTPRTITVNSISRDSICNTSAADRSFAVAFTASGTFSGNFQVQLSDSSGSFPSAISEGIIGSGTASPLTATIPANTLVGSNYRLRVLNTSPEVISAPSNSFTITSPGSATIAYSGSPYCGMTGLVSVTRTGDSTGAFAASPSGLSINASTGQIDLAQSQPGIYTVSYTIIKAGTCTGSVTTQVEIRPSQFFNTISNQLVCAGATVSAMNFGSVAGITYSWTNDNATIGLGASGTGNVAAFTAINTGNTDQAARITVRATGGTACFVTPMIFGITVAPTPAALNAISNQVVCAGQTTTPVTFSNAQGTTIANWTNDNPAIGTVVSASNTPGIGSFIARNPTGEASTVATFTVTPVRRGCAGTPVQFTITVSNSVTSLAYPQATYCQNTGALPILRGGAGGTYSATPAGLSIDAGTGQLNFWNSQPGTYTVTYTLNNAQGSCQASASTQVRVLPRANLSVSTNQLFVCRGATVPQMTFTGSGTAYNWTNSNTAIGLAASGTGDISAFTAQNPTNVIQRSVVRVIATGDGVNTCNSLPQVIYLGVGNCNAGSVTQADGVGGDASTLRTQDVTLSPVPARDRVTVQLAANAYTSRETYTVQLVSQYGGAISKPAVMNGNTYTVDLSGLTPGVYTLRLTSTRTGVSVQKQVVKL